MGWYSTCLNGRLYPAGNKWNKYVTPGLYTVHAKENKDGYDWYELELDVNGDGDNLWAADANSMNILPAEKPDYERVIEELDKQIDALTVELNTSKATVGKQKEKIDGAVEVLTA